ncbi:MAG TPA: ribonuclease P protein subunit [Thermoplasmata archaeon]|nr:ribonuclease P protein subunit [Thermoplasmata archaeon]
MPKEPAAPHAPSRAEAEALAGELIGASVLLPASPARARPVAGTIVDESLSTFTVRAAGRRRTIVVPKPGLEGTIVLPGGELPLRGDGLRVRPEDRTKRLLAGGPRRFR